MSSENKIRLVRTGDFNHDGLEDRVVRIDGCLKDKTGKSHCLPYQVELGKKDGGFAPVFDLQATWEEAPFLEPGDVAMYSPEYFAQSEFVRVAPGIAIPNKVATPPDPDLPRADWKPGDGEKVFFQYNLTENKEIFAPIHRRMVLPYSPKYFTKEFLNLRGGSEDSQKNNPFEIEPHLSTEEIFRELQSLSANLKWFQYGELILPFDPKDSLYSSSLLNQGMKDYIRGQNVAGMKTLKNKAEKYLTQLKEETPTLTPRILVGLLDLVHSHRHDMAGRAAVLDSETVNLLIGTLETHLKKPENLKPLIPYILTMAKSEDLQTGSWPFRIQHLTGPIHNFLLQTESPTELPDLSQILQLADHVPALRAPTLVAVARFDKSRDPRIPSWLGELAASKKSISDRNLAAMVIPSLMDDEEGRKLLLTLAQDFEPAVRLTARQSLIHLPPTGSIEIQQKYLEIFRRGLHDPAVGIQLLSAMVLVDKIHDPYATHTLLKRWMEYRNNPLYADRWSRSVDVLNTIDQGLLKPVLQNACEKLKTSSDSVALWARLTKEPCDPEALWARMLPNQAKDQFVQKYKMDLGMNFPSNHEGAPQSISLKSLLLYSLGQSGLPLEKNKDPQKQVQAAADLLQENLKEEKDETNLILTAQALVHLNGKKSIPILMDRMTQPAPESLSLLTLAIIQQAQVKEAAPFIYPMIQDPRPPVWQAALWTVHSFDPAGALKALLRDSRDPEPATRSRIAEALQYYQQAPSVKRLLEMVEDRDPKVGQQAVLSLAAMEQPAARQLIENYLKKRPEFREKLTQKRVG